MADGLRRGDVLVCAPPGEYGKPRPAVILQPDPYLAARDSVTLCLLTTTKVDAPLFRIPVEPGRLSGLEELSFAMVDKLMTVSKKRLGRKLGRLSASEQRALDRAVAGWLGLEPIARVP